MGRPAARPDVVVIGVGSPYRRDDGVGPAVIARLAHMSAGGRKLSGVVELTMCDTDLTRLLGTWEGTAVAILVDAAKSGEPAIPGTVRRFDFSSQGLPHGSLPASSHGVGLAEAIALGRLLDRLPGRLVVYTVEAAETVVGIGLSNAVAGAVDEVAERVAVEITELAAHTRLPRAGSPPPHRPM